jgi:uroporphyrinogen decarboxylase
MRLLQALRRESLDRPPVWFMRQAGRYLPEYRELRAQFTFEEAMRNPKVAAEITLQPLRRFPLDAAIVFADIMTPLAAMGVDVEFKPGPKLSQHSVADIARLRELDPGQVEFVGETIALARAALDPSVTMIGFCGGPATLIAYLVEGGSSQQFSKFRRAMRDENPSEALGLLSRAMHAYLASQVEAGADVVQMFDSWAGLLSPEDFQRWVVPAARGALADLGVPTIYFAPQAAHLLESFHLVGATAYGVDWRMPLASSWRKVGEKFPIQGNLDPALLLADLATVRASTIQVLKQAGSRPGHIFNLGHGIRPETPIVAVEEMLNTVGEWTRRDAGHEPSEAGPTV